MLSKSCTYGLQAVLFLAGRGEEGYVPIRTISDQLGLSHPFLAKVLQALTREDLLRSQRGANGGVTLARPANDITLAEVVTVLDGARLFETCILGFTVCSGEKPCLLHQRWGPIREQIQTLFTETSVRDMVQDTPLFYSILGQISPQSEQSEAAHSQTPEKISTHER